VVVAARRTPHLQRALDRVHLANLELQLVVDPGDAQGDGLRQLAQRRLQLELGLVPLPLPRRESDDRHTLDGGGLGRHEVSQLLVHFRDGRFRDDIHLCKVV
jgi:hypothetical protein